MEKQLSQELRNEEAQPMETNMESIIANYGGKLRTFAFRFVRSWDLVDDIMQEVYLKVFLKLDTVINQNTLNSWLYTITANQCMDYLRLKYVKATILTENLERLIIINGESVENEIIWKADRRKLHKIISALPTHYKEPLILYYFHNFTYREISEILRISMQNLKTRIHRAKKMIREKYLSMIENQ
ncbi:RNA polymerase sigma factor [Neobacillus jeddahensis]|uniref:RNA polymerase sigma factor n=1 Tax=Neobacillus jeddahensis TaxID=1461580 RepID=UPI00058DA280|nr:RNA polymerase sigma factor [Neobacillus jeddahensis]